jgi:RNA polymerase-interacting CarD/CdnL/TRCF family regulator
MDFKVGEKAVHPHHGVGEVTAVETKEIAGHKKAFYILKIVDTGMKVMVPTDARTGSVCGASSRRRTPTRSSPCSARRRWP